jgi:hypothetical protein
MAGCGGVGLSHLAHVSDWDEFAQIHGFSWEDTREGRAFAKARGLSGPRDAPTVERLQSVPNGNNGRPPLCGSKRKMSPGSYMRVARVCGEGGPHPAT